MLRREPRMQNIPMPETEEGRRLRALVRRVFGVPETGTVLINADYKVLEMRIVRRFRADP